MLSWQEFCLESILPKNVGEHFWERKRAFLQNRQKPFRLTCYHFLKKGLQLYLFFLTFLVGHQLLWQKVVFYLLSKKCSPAHPYKMLSWQNALFKEQFTKGAFLKVCRRAFLRECSLGLSKMLSHILWQNALLAKCSCPQEHFVWRAFCQRIWESIFERAKEHSCKIDKSPAVYIHSSTVAYHTSGKAMLA